jgi:ABC-type phosphate/phosphonate transport system permease subunit
MTERKIVKGSYFQAGNLGQRLMEAAAFAEIKAKGQYQKVPRMILAWHP